MTVKSITKLNLGHNDKFEVQGSRSSDNAFHVLVLQRTAKKCTKNYNARAQPLFFSLNLLFYCRCCLGFLKLPIAKNPKRKMNLT